MKCPKCPSRPEMVVTARRDAIKCSYNGAQRTNANMQMRLHGHPLLATIGGIFSLGVWAINSCLEETDKKCPNCGYTLTQTDFK